MVRYVQSMGPQPAVRRTVTTLMSCALSCWSVLGVARLPAAEIDFGSQVLPILSQHCFACHGPDAASRASSFRLDTRAGATSPIDAGVAIAPGKPEQSIVLQRLTTSDPEQRMPPVDAGPALTTAQVELLTRWIAEGAHYESHWAFQPIRSQHPPTPAPPSGLTEDSSVAASSAAVGDIDRFVLDRLQRAGLTLSPPADRPALIRRVTFDLTGLPPTWQEVQDFVHDPDPDAFAKVVDRLLASPRYGERWGRHWLDIARYADTHGGGAVGYKRFAFSYTYRDYVINALNADVPYDRFITEQLAADQLGLATDDPALAGLGFLTVGRQYVSLHDIIDDRIDVVSRGLMGLTVACARCHDHKYDPIPTEDYYALYATFSSSRAPDELPPLPAQGINPTEHQAYTQELQRRQFRRQEMIREQSEVLRHRLRMQVGMYLRELVKGTPEQDLSVAFLSYRTDDYRPLVLERWRAFLKQLDGDDPVFGVWHRLHAHGELPADQFAAAGLELVQQLAKENGDSSELKYQSLSTQPPRWNPRVLQMVEVKRPTSMLELADVYGALLAEVQQEWLANLSSAAQEAIPGANIIPDEDAAHLALNSSVNRQLRYYLYGADTPTMLSDEAASRLLNRPINDHVSGLRGAIDELHLNSPGSPPRAMVLAEEPTPAAAHVFLRGDPLSRGAPVTPHFLQVLSSGGDRPAFRDGQRRLDLARAIVDLNNPLTRRVLVNWVWQRHFGLGLVRTPDDFGIRGQRPTHPELLDYLADTFASVDHWSLKQLHRRILLTQVYQQASRENPLARSLDPENSLWWRMPQQRLEAEAVRDAMLAASGQLELKLGGRPVDLFVQPFTARRSVYGFINRDVIAGFFSAFDMADPSVCAAKRPQTTVPQQTLFALNSEFIQAQARGLVERDDFQKLDDRASRVSWLYQQILVRQPHAEEIAEGVQYIQDWPADPALAWQNLAHVLLASNEFFFLD